MMIFQLFKKKNNQITEIDKNNLPNHVGIIMDGNGRWARRRGLPRTAGHKVGAQTLKTIAEHASKMGINYLTAYAFSTENWKRPKEEVDAIMELLLEYLRDEKLLEGNDIQVKFIGDRSVLTEEIRQEMKNAEEKSAKRDGTILFMAINYGGQQEIVNSVQKIAEKIATGEMKPADITAETIGEGLYTDIPDVHLIIRPSGEYRLSNFLLWQSAYSEFWFSNINWPDFSCDDFDRAVMDYQARNRRFGGV